MLGDCPLDGHGAGEGRGGAPEGDHEAVAHSLDLGAGVAAHLSPQHGVVDTQDLLGSLVAQGIGEFGRAYDVGEEEGDDRRSSAAGHNLEPPSPRLLARLSTTPDTASTFPRCLPRPDGGASSGTISIEASGRADQAVPAVAEGSSIALSDGSDSRRRHTGESAG